MKMTLHLPSLVGHAGPKSLSGRFANHLYGTLRPHPWQESGTYASREGFRPEIPKQTL